MIGLMAFPRIVIVFISKIVFRWISEEMNSHCLVAFGEALTIKTRQFSLLSYFFLRNAGKKVTVMIKEIACYRLQLVTGLAGKNMKGEYERHVDSRRNDLVGRGRVLSLGKMWRSAEFSPES